MTLDSKLDILMCLSCMFFYFSMIKWNGNYVSYIFFNINIIGNKNFTFLYIYLLIKNSNIIKTPNLAKVVWDSPNLITQKNSFDSGSIFLL